MEIQQRIACKALIIHEGRALILRESSKYEEGTNAGGYDFPGGRLQPGEHFEDGLKREVFEECGLAIEIGKPIYVGEWRPVVQGKELQIVAIFFECSAKSDKVKLSEDHDDYKWVLLTGDDYKNYKLLVPNDIVFKEYIGRLHR